MMCCLVSKSSLPPAGALESLARLCSPRVMACGRTAAMFDASGLARVLGPPPKIVEEVRRLAAADGLIVRAAMAGTMSAAWLLAHASTPVVVIEPGAEAAALAPLPLGLLKTLAASVGSSRPGTEAARVSDDTLAILGRWGLSTLGDFARLPRADVRTRLGLPGVRLHQAACGEDDAPLVPAGDAPAFVARLELDWPIDGLEPLSFVLARACESLSDRLEQADRGAVSIATRLRLVTRETHERTLGLPAPMRDARVLRTLILLDLESHPPEAAIDALEIELGVTAGRIEQGSLLDRTLPSPEDISTLVARLTALAGESRVGSPALVDAHDERAVAVRPFRVPDGARSRQRHGVTSDQGNVGDAQTGCPVVRRFRLPVVARVVVERGMPVRIEPAARGMAGGRVVSSAGPWRSSGYWWSLEGAGWDRDEWDVEIDAGICYRLARHRTSGRWEVEGTID